MLDSPRCYGFFYPQLAIHQGAPMKITYSQVDPEFRAIIEHEMERHAATLNRILKRYSPDAVLLHGSLEKNAAQDRI
jgi:hypothetical protein